MHADSAPSRSAAAKILVTDDEQAVREVIREMLELAGYQVLEATNGRECLDMLRGHSDIGLVILDVIMPEQEGIETLQIVRRDFPDVKLLMVSGGGRAHPRQYLSIAKTMGADDVLSKPFRSAQLLAAIENIIPGETAASRSDSD